MRWFEFKSRILTGLLPKALAIRFSQLGPYGMIIGDISAIAQWVRTFNNKSRLR